MSKILCVGLYSTTVMVFGPVKLKLHMVWNGNDALLKCS
jgi:hypothetical protein